MKQLFFSISDMVGMAPPIFGAHLVQSYVAAEAYAQVQVADAMATAAVAESVGFQAELPASSVACFVDPPIRLSNEVRWAHPYRNFCRPSFPGLHLPQPVVAYLFSLAHVTGLSYSLLKRSLPNDPVRYEIYPGIQDSLGARILLGAPSGPAEWEFFGAQFVAHIVPPGERPILSANLLKMLRDFAQFRNGQVASHVVFGFASAAAVYVKLWASAIDSSDRVQLFWNTSNGFPPAWLPFR